MSGRDPDDVAAYDEWLEKIFVGGAKRLQKPIEIREYDPHWPGLYAREAGRVRRVLGHRVVLLEHAGSTSVPGLPAKPIIDMVLEVADSSDEAAYVPALEAAGYALVVREPDWFKHRLCKGPDTNINLHVFSAGCEETERMLAFRDWLRTNRADRDLYARVKRELSARDWKYAQQYADAKTNVVNQILKRAVAGKDSQESDPGVNTLVCASVRKSTLTRQASQSPDLPLSFLRGSVVERVDSESLSDAGGTHPVIDVQRVDYIRVPVTDMEKANHFYGGVLGLERNPNSPGEDWVEYETGNVTLAVMTPETHDYEFTPLPPGTIALRVPDVAEAKAKLEAAGVQVNEMWDSGVCYGAGVRDPDGNVILLHNRYKPYEQI